MSKVISEVPSVLSEIQSGEGLSLSSAGRMFPAHRGEGTVGPSTVFRWLTKGAKSTDGRLVKLEAIRVGLTQGKNVLRGDRLFVDMTTGVSRVESDSGKVQGLFAQSSGPGCGSGPAIGSPLPGGGATKQK